MKNHLPMHLVESQWLKRFNVHFVSKGCFVFFFLIWFFLLELVGKTKQLYILLTLTNCYFIITSFDLWMSKGAYDIFAFHYLFLGGWLVVKHITIGLFETFDTFGHALAKYLTKLLNKYDLRKRKSLLMLNMNDLI